MTAIRPSPAVAAVALLCALSAHARPPPPPPPVMEAHANWVLRLPKDPGVEFQGSLETQHVDGPSRSMVYPAPDPLTFLVSLAVHGAINQATQQGKKTQQQKDADRVLEPYAGVITRYKARDLMAQGLIRSSSGQRALLLPHAQAAPEGHWILESAPRFSMTQDQRAIVLDNVVALYPPGKSTKPAYANSVRVVSLPIPETAADKTWLAGDGAVLRDHTAALFAASVDLFLRDVQTKRNDKPAAQRTVRYMQGGMEKMERAQVVASACERLELRTLRGWLMSVPANEEERVNCAPPTPPPATEVAETATADVQEGVEP